MSYPPPSAFRPGAPLGSAVVDRDYVPYQAVGHQRFERNEADPQIGFPTGIQNLARQGAACEPTQWEVSVVPRSLTVLSINGGAPTTVPTEAVVGADGIRFANLQVRISYSDGSNALQQIDLDVGPGFAFGFFGTAVQVDVLLDPRTLPLPASLVGGLSRFSTPVSFVNLDASIQRVRSFSSRAIFQFTQTLTVPATQNGVFPRPPLSQTVEVFQTAAGPAETSLIMQTPVGAGVEVGELFFEPGLRRTGRHRIPGGCAQLQTRNTAALDERRFSAVWGIER